MSECSGCHRETDEFYEFNGRQHGQRCKECVKMANKRRYHRDPDKAWAATMKRKYGITPEQYDDMLEAQDHRCYICERKSRRRLAVDHDHRTWLVRGLLCHTCNYLLGTLNDNARLMTRAGEYLANPPAIEVIGEHRVPGAPPVRSTTQPSQGE
jgi:hypothetical protein